MRIKAKNIVKGIGIAGAVAAAIFLFSKKAGAKEGDMECIGFDLYEYQQGEWVLVESNSTVCGWQPPETNPTLQVNVIDRKRNIWVSGLKVVLDDSIIAYTDDGGVARFWDIEPGTHTIQVISDEYTQVSGYATGIEPGEGISIVTVYLEPIEVFCGGAAWFIDGETGQGIQKEIDLRDFRGTASLTSPSGIIYTYDDLWTSSHIGWSLLPYELGYWFIKVNPQGIWPDKVSGRTFTYLPSSLSFKMEPRGYVNVDIVLQRNYHG